MKSKPPLKPEQIDEIRHSPLPRRELANKFNRSMNAIDHILQNKTYKDPLNPPNNAKDKLSMYVEIIRASHADVKVLAKRYGVSLDAIYRVQRGDTYKEKE